MGLIPAHYRALREWFAGYLLACLDGATPEQERVLAQTVGILCAAEDFVGPDAGRDARRANKQAVWAAAARGLGYATEAPLDGTPAAAVEAHVRHTLLVHFAAPSAEDLAAISARASSPFVPQVMGEA